MKLQKILINISLIFFLNCSSKSLKILQNSAPSSVWQIYSKGQTIEKGSECFVKDCKSLTEENKKIPNKSPNSVRIATYNIHFWNDSLKNGNYDGIMKVISNINADILVLQEIVLFDKRIKEDFKKLGFKNFAFCRTQNHWMFGNMVLSKYPLIEKPIVKTFDVDKKLGGEQRGFINFKVQLPNKEIISIYGTHLDVYDNSERRRVEEVKELIKYTQSDRNKNIIIAADFNAIRAKDYQYKIDNKLVWDIYSNIYKKLTNHNISTEALDKLEFSGFKDCFTFSSIVAPQFTAWSGPIIDFIFLNKTWSLPILGCYTLYDSASDHLPIFMDVELKLKAKL